MSTRKATSPGLLERLEKGAVICAEGYLFELERRGYIQAGAFVPEVVLEHPEKVYELHREFVHAGSDVVEAFTYYGHREKLRVIGKEELLEPSFSNIQKRSTSSIANLFTRAPMSSKHSLIMAIAKSCASSVKRNC